MPEQNTSEQTTSEQTASEQALSKPETAEPQKGLLAIALEGAIALAKEGNTMPQATEQFNALLQQVERDSPTVTPLLQKLWDEYLSAQRSATFWQSLSDAEKELSDKMSATTVQLKQNYMRLVQEQ